MSGQDSHRIDDSEDAEQFVPEQAAHGPLHSTNETPSSRTVDTLDRYDGRQLQELPEDDGMTVLRRKIHAIRDDHTSNVEKARLIHFLMTESYASARKIFRERETSLPRSSSSVRSLKKSTAPSPRVHRSFDQLPFSHTFSAATTNTNDHYNLTPEDLEPTYAPRDILAWTNNSSEASTLESTQSVVKDDDSDYSDENVTVLGCQHYKRNVKLQCHACKRWYTCRFCHDEVEDHSLERRKTENMLCMLCGLPQEAAQWCKGCGEQSATYFCEVCKLWDNDSSKSIYHCYDCGICRIGQGIGKDFYHCKTCSVCIPISIENTHRCIERSTQCDCPICGEYMFTSPDTVVFMRCGHSIHQKCYSEYSKTSFRCPICSKSIMNMEARFRNLDRAIESQPMPSEFEDTRALIYCNDCGAKSDVPYHWLGLKCDLCESYNTAQIHLRSGDGETNGEDGTSLRPQSASYDLSDRTCESVSASDVVTESLGGESTLRRPLTSNSAEERSAEGRHRSRLQPMSSPSVGNYFDLSRDSAWTPSIFSSHRSDGESDAEELGFWANSPLRKYSFFRAHEQSNEDESGSDSVSNEDEESVIEDEDEDDFDPIEILGHR